MATSFKLLGKSNLYGRLLLFVVFIAITVMLSSESAFLVGDAVLGPKIGGVIVSILEVGFYLYAVQLLRVLGYTQRGLRRALYGYALVAMVGSFYVANPFVEVLHDQLRRGIFMGFHIINSGIFLSFSGVILHDIFKSDETHADHIWGAIVVYFFAILFFGDLYEIITLMHPGLLGEVYELGWPNYIQCIMYSMNAIAGVDSAYPEAHGLVIKLAVLENITGNLFLVVILGRLLSHPLKKREA